jgi:hypothetical protein
MMDDPLKNKCRMKNNFLIILLTSLLVFTSCSDEGGVYLTMNVLEKTLSPKDTFQFSLTVQGLDLSHGEEVVWSLYQSKPTVEGTEVATITSTGKLTALSLGSTLVKASAGGRYALAQVDVVERAPALAGDLNFGVQEHYMGIIGLIPDTIRLTVKASLLELYDLIIRSDNKEIIQAELLPDTTSTSGEVYVTRSVLLHRGGSEGTAVVSVDAGGTVKSMKVHVGVKAYLSFDRIITGLGGTPSLVTINPYTFYISSRDTIRIYYVAEPDDPARLEQLNLQIKSEGDGVLAVKEIKRMDGHFSIVVESGKLKGSQKFTITLFDNELTAECTIMDRNDVNVNSLTILPDFKTITTTLRGVALGESVRVTPLAAIVHWPVVWSSSDEAIASVNATGDATIFKAGTVRITATSKDKTDYLTIHSQLVLEAIAFAPGNVTTLAESETTRWTTLLTANYDTEGVLKTWSSSNPQAATVDANGIITAAGEGVTQISVSATDDLGNTRTASQQLTVTTVNIASLDFNAKEHQYVSDVAVSGSMTGIAVDVFTPDFSNNYQFRLYRAHSGVQFNLSGKASYTVGEEIHLASTLNYLDVGESAVLQPGSKLIVDNGVLTFDMTARRGTRTVTIKGNVTEYQ